MAAPRKRMMARAGSWRIRRGGGRHQQGRADDQRGQHQAERDEVGDLLQAVQQALVERVDLDRQVVVGHPVEDGVDAAGQVPDEIAHLQQAAQELPGEML